MPTGTIYDTAKHQFDGLPNAQSTCRYCGRSFTDLIHLQPSTESGEQWITREEAEGSGPQ